MKNAYHILFVLKSLKTLRNNGHMKHNFNKSQPNIEYGMLSSRYLNNPKRKPNAEGLVTYYLLHFRI